jgi:hypothetical protein
MSKCVYVFNCGNLNILYFYYCACLTFSIMTAYCISYWEKTINNLKIKTKTSFILALGAFKLSGL